jgi:hypothetical protein
MSFGIVRMQKMSSGSVKGIEIHDRRVKDVCHTNQDIDRTRSALNYDLHPAQHENFGLAVRERIAELDLKKAVRKDAKVMVQALVTSDSEFFKGLDSEQQARFFRDSYNFLCQRYGKENAVSATVHMDEKTPHMHFNFVPVTADGRLSAKDVVGGRNALSNFQTAFHEQVGKAWGLERGVEGSTTRHLETAEYKLSMATQRIAELEADKSQLEAEVETLRELQQLKTKTEEIPIPKKTLIGNKPDMTHEAAIKAIEGNNAYIANEAEIKNIRLNRTEVQRREESVSAREVVADGRERQLGEKEKQIDTMYQTQSNLNQLYEQEQREKARLKKKLDSVIKDANDRLKKGHEMNTALNAQNQTLSAELKKAKESIQSLTETFHKRLQSAWNTVRNIVQAVGLLKYSENNFNAGNLSEEQERLIDAASNLGADLAAQDGFHEHAKSMRESVMLSPVMKEYVTELENDAQSHDGWRR